MRLLSRAALRRTTEIARWLSGYLYRAPGHRALRNSVLAQGERQGYVRRSIYRAAQILRINPNDGVWQLPPDQVRAFDEAAQLPGSELAPRGDGVDSPGSADPPARGRHRR